VRRSRVEGARELATETFHCHEFLLSHVTDDTSGHDVRSVLGADAMTQNVVEEVSDNTTKGFNALFSGKIEMLQRSGRAREC
jgi:hypothetical protein